MIGQNKDLKVIMTTSANPGSGKTFISYNLAKCMSLKGKKVCAIDLDLRRRSLSDYVGKPDQGVSDYINGAVSDWHDVLVPGEGSDTFFILPAGTLPPNPAEIISYDRFTELINEIREEFDYVFFDCPPVEIVADTSILAKHADISLFVIRVGLMELDFLPVIECHIISCVDMAVGDEPVEDQVPGQTKLSANVSKFFFDSCVILQDFHHQFYAFQSVFCTRKNVYTIVEDSPSVKLYPAGTGIKVGVGVALRSAILRKTLPVTWVTRKLSKNMMLLLE